MYKAKKPLKTGGGMKNCPCWLLGYSFLKRNYVRKTTTFIHIFVLQLYLDGGAGIDNGGLDEPGQAQAEQDVEYVAADGIAHRHVP